MAKIDIEISQPVAACITIAAVVAAVVGVDYATGWQAHASAEPVGGTSVQEIVQEGEEHMQELRQKQAVLQKRAEILRFQLQLLQEERRLQGPEINPAMDQDLTRSEQMIVDLIRDQGEAEAKILLTLQQMWEAEGRAIAISKKAGEGEVKIAWPIDPALGISATFDDPHYEEIFGMPHKAIDIPTQQGTIVHAVAGGIVEGVNDNGYGYNSVIIKHDGFATLYGHVQKFLVEEGERVAAGDPIAESGGRPGELGSGLQTTGPHLHFELIVQGERIDPLLHLPSY